MAQQVKLRRSSVAGNKPTTSQLELGELAINTNDGKLYFEKSSSLGESVQEIIVTDAWNTGSLNISGSVTISGSIIANSFTGSFLGTSSYANSALTASYTLTASYFSGSVPLATTASYSVTASYALAVSGSGVVGDISGRADNITAFTIDQDLGVSDQVSFGGVTSSFLGNLTGTASFATTAISASYALSSSYAFQATTASYVATASYTPNLQEVTNQGNITTTAITSSGLYVNGNAIISGNLNVLGTASFANVTSSVVIVGDNTIILNTDAPSVRFGGIEVIDSGSFGNSSTGSLLWDSEKNRWIYSNPSGSTYDGGLLMSGPRNTTGLGNEEGTTLNAILKGQGGDHLTSSAIIENGTSTNFYNSASIITSAGSVTATSFTGSLLGTASYAANATTASYASSTNNIANAIVNNTDNYLLTAQGTGIVNGESLLQFDGNTLKVLYQSGDEGGEILLGKAATNTTLTGSGVTVDIWQNRLRFFEQGGAARGAFIDITACAPGVGTNLLTGGGTGTVTSVSASGTVSGITLGGGPITTSGSLTLSGTISGLTNSNLSGTAGITNANLANPSLMIGSTGINLGATGSSLAGLTSVTATSFTGSLFGTASYAILAATASYFSGSLSAPGSTTQILYNNAGTVAGDSGLVYSGSRVGIGTTSPATKLQVNGTFASNALWTDATSVAYWGSYPTIYGGLTWDTGYAMVFATTGNALRFATNGSGTSMTIDTSGNVGIGTTNPFSNAKLQVRPASDTNIAFQPSTTLADGIKINAFNDAANANVNLEINGLNLALKTNETERIRVTSTGYVGIGTTNPTQYSSLFPAQLAVNAGSSVDGIFSTTNDSSAAELVLFKKNPTNSFGSLLIQHSGSSGRAIELNYGVNMSTGVGGTTSYFVNTNGSGYYAGSVGIGTTSPTYNLHTYGVNPRILIQDSSTGYPILQLDNSSDGSFYISIDNSSGTGFGSAYGRYLYSEGAYPMVLVTNSVERMRITSAGNVGIGTTSPNGKLQLNQGTDLNVAINTVTNDATTVSRISSLNDAATLSMPLVINGNRLVFTTDASERMRITSAGNVLIGTTGDNGQKFQLLGDAAIYKNAEFLASIAVNSNQAQYQTWYNSVGTVRGYLGYLTNSSNVLSLDNTSGGAISLTGGNVGIGTTGPGAKLDIVSTGAGSEGLRVDGTGGGFAFVVKGGSDYTSHIRAGATIGVNYFTTPPSNGLIVEGNVGIGTTSPAAKLDIKGDLIVSSSLIANQNTASLASGAQTISTNATSSYTAAFYNYTVASGSNARAGQVTAVWNGGSIQYTDVSTTDIGSTLGVAFTASLSGANVQLTTIIPTSGWTVKTLVNLI